MWRWSVCTKRHECQQEGSLSTDAGVPTSLARLVSIVAKFERIFSRATLSLPRGETKSPCWRFATVEAKSNNDCNDMLRFALTSGNMCVHGPWAPTGGAAWRDNIFETGGTETN